MASEHGEEIIRKEHSKRGESRARRGAVGDCSRTFGATRFLLLYSSSFPDPSPVPSRNYSLHRYFHQSSRLVPRNHQKRINHCTNNCASRFYPTNLRKSSPRKIPKIRGNFKIGRRLGIEKCWYKLFLFEEGCPLESARSFFQAGATRRRAKVDTGRRVREGGKETERQLSRFQNRRVARARHSLGGHPCDLPEEFTGRPGSARAGSSPNLDSKARGEGTPDPDQPRNREPATLHGSGSSSGFLKPARTGAPLLRRALSPTDFWSKAAEVAKSCYSCLEG